MIRAHDRKQRASSSDQGATVPRAPSWSGCAVRNQAHYAHQSPLSSVGMSPMVASAAFLAPAVPIPRTTLIGREAELAAARAFLLDEAVPLLTLSGPGGVGKTRLALAIAQNVAGRFVDGIAWVDLAPLTEAVLLPTTVASALGLPPSAGSPVEEQLAGSLRARHTLLLLDNCEHVVEETANLVGYLLSRCPALQMLATSRARL